MNMGRSQGVIVTLVGLAITCGLAVLAPGYFQDGAQIPVHWGLDGPDQFATPEVAARYLWLMPGTCLFAGCLFAFMPLLDPFRENVERSHKAYTAVWTGVIALFVFIQIGLAAAMTGLFIPGEEFPRAILGAIGLFFIVIGNYLPKTRVNFIFGIRTPWTLTSDSTWEKTHRLGGRLFILAGFLAIGLSIFADGDQMAILFTAILLPLIAILFVYSFLVWRKADDRMSASDYIV